MRSSNSSAYSVDSGTLLFFYKVSPDQIRGNIVFTPDGRYLITSRTIIRTEKTHLQAGELFQYATYLDFFDAKSGQLVKSIHPVHVMHTTAIAVSPDSRLVATGTNTGRNESHKNPKTGVWDTIDNKNPIRLWDIESGKLIKEFGPLEGHVQYLVFSPDSKNLASCFVGQQPENLWLWNVESGQLLETIFSKTGNHIHGRI